MVLLDRVQTLPRHTYRMEQETAAVALAGRSAPRCRTRRSSQQGQWHQLQVTVGGELAFWLGHHSSGVAPVFDADSGYPSRPDHTIRRLQALFLRRWSLSVDLYVSTRGSANNECRTTRDPVPLEARTAPLVWSAAVTNESETLTGPGLLWKKSPLPSVAWFESKVTFRRSS